MKRAFVPLAILLVCAFILSGCASSSTTTAPAPTTAALAPTSAAPAPTSAAPAPTSAAPAPTSAAPAKTTPPAPAPTSSAPAKTTPAALQPQYGGTLRWIRNMGIPIIGAPADTPSMNFVDNIESPVFENVVGEDAIGRFKPLLAESADVSSDGKTITLHLLKGVKFQDGTDFNAAAVKYNLQAVLAANSAASGILKLVNAYNIIDDYTLQIVLDHYDARLLLTLAETANGQIASPTAMQKSAKPEDHMVGTGPFKFDSWQLDQFVKMVKWNNYRVQGRPYVDAIELRNNSDLTVSLMSFKAGEVNMVENIDPSQYVQLQKEGYAVGIPPLAFVFPIIFDSASADSPFKDIRVRQAVEYAIDKESMTKGIGLGTQFPAYQFAKSPPLGQDPWYVPNLTERKYDPAKAKQLLAEAGYPNGFTYPLISDVRIRQDQVVAIQTYLKAVGINTTLDMADVMRASTFGIQGFKGIYVPGFPFFSSFTQWVAVFDDPVVTWPSRWVPPGFKASWDAVTGEINYDKRISMMQDLMKQAVDQAIMVPYLEDGPRYVTDGTIHDMQWDQPGVSGGYDPVNVWLSKK